MKPAREMTDAELRKAFRYFDDLKMRGRRLTAAEDARWEEIDREFQRRSARSDF